MARSADGQSFPEYLFADFGSHRYRGHRTAGLSFELNRHLKGTQVERVDVGEFRGANKAVAAGIKPRLVSGDHLFNADDKVHSSPQSKFLIRLL
jgi:hypothetical protein